MEYEEPDANLSQMSTNWAFVFQSHSGTPDEVTARLTQLMCRYAGAVHRYLLKALRDHDAAAQLDLEFAHRFLRGDFRNCDPMRGRFRDYVKQALQDLISDYHRRKPATIAPDARIPEANPGNAQFDQDFVESWRKDLLERAWNALAELEKTTGQPFYTVLRSKVNHPDKTSSELAERLSIALGQPFTAGAFRQALQRSRRKYVDYLLTDVRASLDHPTHDTLDQELTELNLLQYCRAFMKPRGDLIEEEKQSPGPILTNPEPPPAPKSVPTPPAPSGDRTDESPAAEPSLLDQIIETSRARDQSIAATEASVASCFEEMRTPDELDSDRLEFGRWKQVIDAALETTSNPLDIQKLNVSRKRLEKLRAKHDESVSKSALTDEVMIDDAGARDRFQAGAECINKQGSPDIATISPATIRRHTDVSFPGEVQTGKVYNLRVQVVPATAVLPSGEVREQPRPHPHDATMELLVPAPPTPDAPPPPITLTISLAAENFEIEGPVRAEILVPLEGKSSAVQFGLRGRDVGPGRIMIDFAQNGRPAGSVDLTPVIVASGTALQPAMGPRSSALELSLTLNASPCSASPDVVLKVFEHRLTGHPGRLHFVLSSSHPDLADLPVLDGDLGTLDLRGDLSDWVGEQLRVVGNLVGTTEASAGDVQRTMAGVGFKLFEHLLPPAVQEMCWTFRERGVKTLMILSDDPHIPWELVKPFRADPATGTIIAEDAFWGESYALTHWLRGRPPISRHTIARVMGVAAAFSAYTPGPGAPTRDMVRISTTSTESGGRPGAVIGAKASGSVPHSTAAFDEELEFLRTLEALGARVERLPALRQALRQAFEQGSFDLLHLVSHGSFGGPDAGDATAVYLDDGAFTAAELTPWMAAALRRAAPLVIFNTCHCGRIGFSLTRLGSWGAHLVRMGCGAFIGALWPVTDRAALAFARAFYEQLISTRPLGEAVRLARLRVRDQFPGDPTWLAYCCFADPTAQFEPGHPREM